MGIIWSTLTLPIRTSIRLVLACLSLFLACIRLVFTLVGLGPLFAYLAWVGITSLGLGLTLGDETIGRSLVKTLPALAGPIESVTTVCLDAPQNVLVVKLVVLLAARLTGVLGYWLGWLVMLVDLASLAFVVYAWQASLRQVESLDLADDGDAGLSMSQLLARSCSRVYRPATTVSVFKDISVDRPTSQGGHRLYSVYTTSFEEIASVSKPVVVLLQRDHHAVETIPLILAERGLVVVVTTTTTAIDETLAWTRKTIKHFGGSPDELFLVVLDADADDRSAVVVDAARDLSGIVLCRPTTTTTGLTVPHLTLLTGSGGGGEKIKKQENGDGTTINLRTGGRRIHGIGSVITGEVIAKWVLRVQSQGKKGR